MNAYFLGIDLGQSRDYSTIAIVERAEMKGDWDAAWFTWRKVVELRLRKLVRIPLGTPYPEVVDRVTQVSHAPAFGGKPYLAVDATGAGRPVVDLLKRARPAGRLMPVEVHGGNRQTRPDDYYHVPKRDLIVGLQVLFQEGALRIAGKLELGPTFVEELQAMEVRVSPSGHEQFAAWRTGSHDDLVFAVALACWAARQVYPVKREEWWTDRWEAERAEVFRKEVRKDRDQF
jgi:hypothetical protein